MARTDALHRRVKLLTARLMGADMPEIIVAKFARPAPDPNAPGPPCEYCGGKMGWTWVVCFDCGRLTTVRPVPPREPPGSAISAEPASE